MLPATMTWFEREAPDALAHALRDAVPQGEAMERFAAWVTELAAPKVLAACPAPFDFMWVNWYLYTFLGERMNPPLLEPLFTGSALDIATLFAGRDAVPFAEMPPARLPEDYLGGYTHSRNAIDDALGYASVLHKMARFGTVTDLNCKFNPPTAPASLDERMG